MNEDIHEADKAQTQSINTKFKLLQYKWLMRTYLTPSRLNHTCVKCRENENLNKNMLKIC